MRTRSDQIAKTLLAQALEPFGKAVTEQEVCAPDPQRIDLWFVPGPLPPQPPRFLRWVVRMGERPCLIEPQSQTVEAATVRSHLRKQLTWHQVLVRRARREGRPAPELPRLWTVSPGRPRRLLEVFPAAALAGWPRGFYRLVPGLEAYLLVLDELPGGIETLVLRLLGRDRTRQQAVKELGQLPGSDPEVQQVRAFVVSLRQIIARDTTIRKRDREAFMTAVQAEFYKLQQDLIAQGVEQGVQQGIQQGLQQGIAQGVEQGIEQGLREGIRTLCEVLEIPLTAARERRLEGLDRGGLRTLLRHLKTRRAWPAAGRRRR